MTSLLVKALAAVLARGGEVQAVAGLHLGGRHLPYRWIPSCQRQRQRPQSHRRRRGCNGRGGIGAVEGQVKEVLGLMKGFVGLGELNPEDPNANRESTWG